MKTKLNSPVGTDTTAVMTTKKKTKKENIITIRYQFKENLQKDAEASGHTLSSYINWILRNRSRLGKPPREDREEG